MCHVWIIDSPELPTHALLHFEIDRTVCSLPVKRIIKPPLLELATGCACTVRWSGRKQYSATVLCLGNNFTRSLLSLISSCFLLSIRWCNFGGQKEVGVGVITLQWWSGRGRAEWRHWDSWAAGSSLWKSDPKKEAQDWQGTIFMAMKISASKLCTCCTY